jgi:hypothetical protein
MSYILGIVVVVIFFAVMHYFTELEHKQKAAATLVVIIIIAAAYYYNHMQNIHRDHVMKIGLKFTQNKTLLCEGVEVNQSNFTTSIGTFTFIGKENSDHAGRMFSYDQCQ